MLTIRDYIDRANEGEVMSERDFSLKIAKTLRKIYKKYEGQFVYDPKKIIPDDKTADIIFEGGVELLSTVGMYHTDTQRVIRFTEEEVREIAATRPHQITLGTGKDQIVVKQRTNETETPIVNVAGPVGSPLSEDIFIACSQSYIQEWTCDGLLSGVLAKYQGMENIAGLPNEMIVATKELEMTQEACRNAGRPGLYVGCTPVGGVSPDAVIGAIAGSKLDPLRGQAPVQPLPESKLHWGHYKIAAFCQKYGMEVWNSGVATIGGLARNPVEAAMARMASILGELGLTNGASCTVWCTDMNGITNARRNVWVNCAITKALDRHAGVAAYLLGYGIAGSFTKMSFQEIAAYTIAYTCAGGELIWGATTGNGIKLDNCAGLNARMVGEVSEAVAGYSEERANDIVDKLYLTFEDKLNLADAPAGKVFQECYNLDNLQPVPEFKDLFYSYKKELTDEFDIRFRY